MIMSQIYRAGALLPFMIPDRFNLNRLFSNGAAATELAGIENQLWPWRYSEYNTFNLKEKLEEPYHSNLEARDRMATSGENLLKNQLPSDYD